MLPIVPTVCVIEHPMSNRRDLFLLVVMCPYCSREHAHGPVECQNGVPLGIRKPSRADCNLGEYRVDATHAFSDTK